MAGAGAIGWLRPWERALESEAPAALPDKPSLAVLPFDNLSDDPEDEYFADGLTDDLITDLSKISGLFVIARNSAFAYKDQPLDVREVARELGVRYVLEGSVRRAGERVRINAQLIDGDHRRPCLGRALRSRLRRHLRRAGRGHRARSSARLSVQLTEVGAGRRSRGCRRAASRHTTITCARSRSCTARKGDIGFLRALELYAESDLARW